MHKGNRNKSAYYGNAKHINQILCLLAFGNFTIMWVTKKSRFVDIGFKESAEK